MDPQYKNVGSKLLGPDQASEIIGAIKRDDFEKDFVFGSGTSAYQFEGAAEEGGKGPSIWDSWTHNQPDKVIDGTNGDVAVDQYHMYKDDVKLMKRVGLESYRFSISWPRVLPGGKLNGGVNKDGIKFYNDLIDTLLDEGIEPYATLFHFDLPLALELEYGGFLSDNIVQDFCEYAELCFWEFGDRVKNWVTFNEPLTYCATGYVRGTFPPGHGLRSHENAPSRMSGLKGAGVQQVCSKGDPGREPYLAAHNMLLAHANAVDLYRKQFQEHQGGKIGISNVTSFFEPLNDTDEDRNACIRALDWAWGWFVAPIATGDYPPNMRKAIGDRLPKFSTEETKLIKGAYDFLGLNYYTTYYATNTPNPPGQEPNYYSDQELTTQSTKNGVSIGEPSGSDWLVIVPRGIYNLLVYTKETYKIHTIYITENGVDEPNNKDLPLSQARLDPVRIKYHNDHLWYIKKAIREAGVNVKAYFLWSFSDNFEWSEGFTVRFGIFYVNLLNGHFTRYPKRSAIWWMNFFNKKSIKNSMKREIKEIEPDYDSRKKNKGQQADRLTWPH